MNQITLRKYESKYLLKLINEDLQNTQYDDHEGSTIALLIGKIKDLTN